MEDRNKNNKDEANNSRAIAWIDDHSFQGWTCSVCEWNYPLPTLLNDPAAKTAYDRLALGKFRDHPCENYPRRLGSSDSQNFTARIRSLVKQGFKPKDAVDLFLQEITLEYRGQPKVLEQAKAEGEDFLRRFRAGLI